MTQTLQSDVNHGRASQIAITAQNGGVKDMIELMAGGSPDKRDLPRNTLEYSGLAMGSQGSISSKQSCQNCCWDRSYLQTSMKD